MQNAMKRGDGLSTVPDPELLSRLRWRCRRGLLELDILLLRFVELHYAALTGPERLTFDQILDMPDNPLWDIISGRQDAASEPMRAIFEKIKSV